MFDVGWSELMVIGGVALVVIGPKDIPFVVRSVTGFVRKARIMASEFQQTLTEAADQADLKELRKQLTSDIDDFKDTMHGVDLVNQNAIANSANQVGQAFEQAINSTTTPPAPITPATPATALNPTQETPKAIDEAPKRTRKPRTKKGETNEATPA